MNSEKLLLAIDQGTSGTKSLIFDETGKIHAKGSEPLRSYYPQPGYVEQNPEEIFQNVLASVKLCLDQFIEKGGNTGKIIACGISNQRETFVVWDEHGKALYPAVVWQCKRSVGICERLEKEELGNEINQKTGLIIDPYFSGTKMIWLYENVDRVKKAVDEGKAYFGTIDSWLLYKLTQGEKYYTDYTNASRTLFFGLETLRWDRTLLEKIGLGRLNLPEPKPSSFTFGQTDFAGLMARPVQVTGMLGDSHAAAFGEGCHQPGSAKATLGTGSSILWNVGAKPVFSRSGMVSTVCWSTAGRVDYALEGIIVSCGATIEWLRNQLGILTDSKETEKMAESVKDNHGVYLIPAFSGLGAPHWKMDARAMITGLTFGADKNHVVRAALESIPYQIRDVVDAMEEESGIALKEINVDGGISVNRFVVQFLADLLKTRVINIGIPDVSALGAALMAGLGAGIYASPEQIKLSLPDTKSYVPGADQDLVERNYQGWKKMIKRLV
ncbi:MAG: glycerol kinase GlpK [Cyclobacteriaceae bacterium]|nr:glycerol kinase GlpK [Cyclobacteriaceae bacterium]